MNESLKFYQEIVGLELINRFQAGPDTEISFLGNGETKVELICNDSDKNINPGNAVSLGFNTESLDEKINLVKENGIKITAGPTQPNANLKFFMINDPNGITIQFAEQM
jgi:lactoylglutathione lyase